MLNKELEESPFTILIVDDEEESRKINRLYSINLLKKLNFEDECHFLFASNAEEGIQVFNTNKDIINIALLDYHMTNGEIRDPHLNGDRFLEATNHQITTAVITTDPKEDIGIKMRKLGASVVIRKDTLLSNDDKFGRLAMLENIVNSELRSHNLRMQVVQKNIELQNTKDELTAVRAAVDQNFSFSKTNEKEEIVHVNDIFTRITGYSSGEVIGKKHKILRSPETKNGLIQTMMETIKKGLIWNGQVKNLNKFGKEFYIKTIIAPVVSSIDGEITGYINIAVDISNLYNEAKKDHLTGCFKRPTYEYVFQQKMDLYNKDINGNHDACAIMIDIDNFKNVNDTYGHNFGDIVIREVASITKRLIRSSDYSIRWGGEEFVVLLLGASKKNGEAVAEKIRQAVDDVILKSHKTNCDKDDECNVDITISLGLTSIDFENDTSVSLVKRADDAMYQAKKSGKNKVVVL